jgi:hypothetical protein
MRFKRQLCFKGRPLIIFRYYLECRQEAYHQILFVAISSNRDNWQGELIPMLEAVINFHIHVDFFTLHHCSYNFIELTFLGICNNIGNGHEIRVHTSQFTLEKSMLLLEAGIILVWEITCSSATEHILMMN